MLIRICSISSFLRNLKATDAHKIFRANVFSKAFMDGIQWLFGVFGLFGRVLEVFLSNVLQVSVAGIFRGTGVRTQSYDSFSLKMPATETGEALGRKTFRTRPNSLKNLQQPLRLCLLHE